MFSTEHVSGAGESGKWSGAGRKTSERERSGERDFRKKERSGSGTRSGRSGNGNKARSGLLVVTNFLKTYAGSPTRLVLSRWDYR
jgi:hypothetical protein